MLYRKGFTLIELLVVIAIIMIMFGAIRPTLTVSSSQARTFECESNLRQVGIALQSYTDDYGAFPRKLIAVDNIIQDRNVLRCPRTGRDYYYRAPKGEVNRHTILASCVNTRRLPSQLPHQSGECYLSLCAGGGVKKVHRH